MKTSILLSTMVASAYAFCPNSCSGNGECGENDKCQCYDRFTGADCSYRECPYGLSWVTSNKDVLAASSVPMYKPTPFTNDGAEVGKSYWTEATGFHAYTECSSKGRCDKVTGQCRCFDGYNGAGCRRSQCANDCSGHGRCVLGSDVWQVDTESAQPREQQYGEDMLLAAGKQYWDNKKATQCICDSGFTGADCSVRVCPKGDDPSSSCSTELEFSDIQAVGLFNEAGIDRTRPDLVEQFFTLKFTDMFNNEFETKPLSYYDNARTVQQALMGLANFAVPNVEVYKLFPEDDDDLLGVIAGQNAVAVNDLCATWYHQSFQDVTCTTDAHCQQKFGLPAYAGGGTISSVFCDLTATNLASVDGGRNTVGICIETQDSCAYADGNAEFVAGCGDYFEPDGIYSLGGATAVWGRRLTTFERSCHVGKFVDGTNIGNGADDGVCMNTDSMLEVVGVTSESDCNAVASQHWRQAAVEEVAFSLACTADKDCAACGGWTAVTMGTCSAAGKCVNLGTYNGDASIDAITAEYPLVRGTAYTDADHTWASQLELRADGDGSIEHFNDVCRTSVLLIKFSDAANAGVQNILEVTADDEDTNADGAAPKYVSAGLKSMGVQHVGMPDYQSGTQGSYTVAGGGRQYAIEIPTAEGASAGLQMNVVRTMTMSADGSAFESAWGASSTAFSVFNYDTFNNYATAQSVNLESFEGDKEDAPKVVASGKPVYTVGEIDSVATAGYDEVLQCSNQGACGYDTGLCTCASGFTGEACGTQVSFV